MKKWLRGRFAALRALHLTTLASAASLNIRYTHVSLRRNTASRLLSRSPISSDIVNLLQASKEGRE